MKARHGGLARFAGAEGLSTLAEFVKVDVGKGADALDRCPDSSPRRLKPTAWDQALERRLFAPIRNTS